jgi:cbb3-type cytochrome oxidase subunit 3
VAERVETVAVIIAAALVFFFLTYRGRAILGGVFYAFSDEKRRDFEMADALDRQLREADAAEDAALAKRWQEPAAARPHHFEARTRDPLFASTSRYPRDVCAACGKLPHAHAV